MSNTVNETNRRVAMKASELIAILQKRIAENGDLEITINTQDGGSYDLRYEDDISIIERTCKDGSKVKMFEIS